VRGTNTFGAATLTVANGFTNTGVIDLTNVVSAFNAQLNVTAGTLVNAPSGQILASAGVGASRTIGAQLDNQGLVAVNAPLVLAFAGADHLNSGTIDVVGNNFQVTQSGTTPSFANSGAINLTAGRTFTNSNGTLDLTGGTVSGYASTLVATGATTLVFTVPQARTRLQLGTGTIIPGTFTVPAGDSLRLVTGSFTAPNLTLNGRMVVEDVVTVTSAITTGLPADTAIVIRGSTAFGAATLTVSTGIVNTGIIHLTSVGSGFNSTLNITTGSLVNASGARILATPGAGGTRTIGAPISQNGLLTVNASATLSLGGMLTLNPGSTSTVLGTLLTTGGCTNNGGAFSGFLCP
jgi:fibronectin-binding autotransporter adhesin